MVKPFIGNNDAPWKLRYRARMILWARMARLNKKRGVVCTNQSGSNQLYSWNTETGKLVKLTSNPEGIVNGFISPEGHFIYYLQDTKGDEIGHWVRLPYAGGTPVDISPGLPPYSAFGLNFSADNSVVGFTAGMEDGFHLETIDLTHPASSDKPREIYYSEKIIFGPALSCDGRIAALTSTERTTFQRQSVLILDVRTGNVINELWDGAESALMASRFSHLKNDYRLLGTANRSGFIRPVVWDLKNGERLNITLDDLPGEISPVDWSPNGNQILLVQSYRAEQQYYLYDIKKNTAVALIHPPGAYSMNTYFTSDDEIFALWEDSTHPPKLIGLITRPEIPVRTVLDAGPVPPGQPWRSITYQSSDGQEIQGWLAVPEGEGPFPTILHTHGGPETYTTDSYFPSSQAWLDHGFAFLAINYRGSTGFGKKFREQIWGDLGHWELEDMAAARQWLVTRGISQPDKIFLTGWSYGGYLTLLALAKQPDLWAGGMAGMATTDWAQEYTDLSPALRGYSVAIMGGTPEEKPERYARSSPITYAANIKVPVLIIQGRNDTRTPARPVEVFEAKLKSLCKPIEVYWYDAGHDGGDVEDDIEHMGLMLQFALKIVS